MKKEAISIDNIPAFVWGDPSDQVYLFVHGKLGSKEDAAALANVATVRGYQVISVDLPGYGERNAEIKHFDPWHVVPELQEVLKYCKGRWGKINLYATSIGAWFSILSYQDEMFETCMFLSPVLDMANLIRNMMQWAGITEEELEVRKTVVTAFGETLYWEYYQYAKSHPINRWNKNTYILYGTKDNLTEHNIVNEFTSRFHCNLTVMEGGEHWFHTEEQIAVLENWIKDVV